jgi:SAM-dependent methyltransferase
VSQLWDERAQLYRESEAHREGEDLDLIVAWACAAPGRRALDVATGGGHVARRLREAGFEVTSSDPAPAMEPDVVCRAEELPFADGSFDVVACRVAAHHFDDVAKAVAEMARVSSETVIVADNLYLGEDEWRALFEQAGLTVDEVGVLDKPIALEPWLERAGCRGETATRVRALLVDRIDGDTLVLSRLVMRGRKR